MSSVVLNLATSQSGALDPVTNHPMMAVPRYYLLVLGNSFISIDFSHRRAGFKPLFSVSYCLLQTLMFDERMLIEYGFSSITACEMPIIVILCPVLFSKIVQSTGNFETCMNSTNDRLTWLAV